MSDYTMITVPSDIVVPPEVSSRTVPENSQGSAIPTENSPNVVPDGKSGVVPDIVPDGKSGTVSDNVLDIKFGIVSKIASDSKSGAAPDIGFDNVPDIDSTFGIESQIIQNIIPITDFSCPELDVYARLTERQICPRSERDSALFIAESPMVIHRALDAGFQPVSLLMEQSRIAAHGQDILARCPGIPVYTASMEILTQLTGFQLTRGILCAMRRKPEPTAEDVCREARRIAVLEDVQNPTNVGAIFRSAAALGVDAVLLTGACADPYYRRAVRVSMGSVFQIPWARISHSESEWPDEGLSRLENMGFTTAALALTPEALPIDAPSLRDIPKLAMVLGTEGDGLKKETIARCRFSVRIPMSHGVDSLNVAAASAVAFWQFRST